MDLKKIFKNRNNRIMLIILIIGIAVIIAGSNAERGKILENNTDFYGEEERLAQILSEIDGVGEVSVMISYVSTMEKDLAYDGQRAVTSRGDVVIRRELFPEVRGVIVIAEGAKDVSVKSEIKEAVTAVTGAAANRVCVYESNK